MAKRARIAACTEVSEVFLKNMYKKGNKVLPVGSAHTLSLLISKHGYGSSISMPKKNFINLSFYKATKFDDTPLPGLYGTK